MKSILAAASLAIATTALPAVAIAQDAMAVPTIVVTGKYQERWEKGSKLEAEGLGDLEEAKKNLVRYSADVVDGQNKRDGSGDQSDNASAEFRKLTSNMAQFSDGKEASRWARQVEKAASNWAKYDNRRGDGRNELNKAMKKQTKAQEAVEKAQLKVERGRAMKAEAERLSALGNRN